MNYSIIVAIDNNFALTNNFIENLLLTTDLKNNGELVIVSDGCNDAQTLSYLENLSTRDFPIKIIYNNSKVGYGIANNIAVDNSNGDILVFINSDVFPLKGSIEKLVAYLKQHLPKVGAVQGLLVYPQTNKVQSTGHLFIDLQNTHVYQGANIENPIIKKTDLRQALTSAFYAIPRNIFLEYGKFDEYYYNAYEGFEFTLKLNSLGFQCIYYPEAVAYHISGGTRGTMHISESQQSKYFIQKWGNTIITDIDCYILPQLNSSILERMYTSVILSQLNGWENILEKLCFNINGYIYHPHYGEVNLYQLFPYSFLNFGGNYLFIVDSLDTISKNYNWISNRKKYHDVIIDSHGNVTEMRALI